MAKVTITLEDHDGEIVCLVDHHGKFELTSNAHQVSHLVIKRLDEIMERSTYGEVTDVEPKEVTGAPV